MSNEKILVLDFGGQYNQLIARRVRECSVYSEIYPNTVSIEEIKEYNPTGIIFTGGPNSVYSKESPTISKEIFELGIPILGICYGSQLMAYLLDGHVEHAKISEYGKTNVKIKNDSLLYQGLETENEFWMSHTDYISQVPDGFDVTGYTKDCPVASMENAERKLYAVQYHPEVSQNASGKRLLENFIYNVCGCKGEWQVDHYAEAIIEDLKIRIGDKKVLCALSGGVDSSVAAILLSKAIGNQLTCVFVDNGLLRKNEVEEVETIFGKNGLYNLNLIKVNAQERFYNKLKGIIDPEEKRKIIGEEFIRIFEEEAKKIGNVDYLVQGTIYSDVIESGIGPAAKIKSHHNVGGLPKDVDFKEIIEPLRLLFKEDVKRIALELGLPENIINKQPFPGPGLGIRIIGEITKEKVRIVQEADYIFTEEIEKAGLNNKLGQYFAVLTNMKSVGVMGDERTYDYAVCLRAVTTTDFMTAEWARIPYDVLDIVSRRIVNEVKGVNRILLDCTSKPPATIEFE